jgi:hypothetical protein
MRSTRATAAIERLKARSGIAQYSMVRTSEGLFYLVSTEGGQGPVKLSEAMEMDAFVAFVNAYGPQTPRRVSKLDVAFEKQLAKKER